MDKKSSRLKDRLKKSYEDRDKGMGGGTAFDWKKIDGEVKFYKMTKGKHRLNIIPYKIQSKNHPLVRSGEWEIGDEDYVFDFYLHRGIGPANSQVICQKKTLNKACPICALRAEYEEKGKKEEADDLRPQRLVLYNIIDADDPDTSEHTVLQISHFNFEKELIEEARESGADGEMVDFPDIKHGKVVTFRASEATFDGHTYFEFKNFSFENREERLDAELVEKAISFDSIMKLPSKEEMEKILYGDDEDEDAEEEKPAKRTSKKDDDEDEDEEEEKPEPKKPAKKPVDDDDEEEEVPKPKKASPKDDDEVAEKCPSGHKFGVETDKFPKDCDDCKLWDDCLKAKVKNSGKK